MKNLKFYYKIEYQLCLQHLQMAPGTLVFGLWRKPPIDVYLKVYIFNITNPKEFLNREEDLKLQEVGPYVYQ